MRFSAMRLYFSDVPRLMELNKEKEELNAKLEGLYGEVGGIGGVEVTVHAYVPSNGICRGFAFKYDKFLLPPFSYGTFDSKSAYL